MNDAKFTDLIGKTCSDVRRCKEIDELHFTCTDGTRYKLHHFSECCEIVTIEDICGDLQDLVFSPILQAEESTNQDNPPEHCDSFLWTFYRLATAKGQVVIRWLGQSNGYYSESVDFDKI